MLVTLDLSDLLQLVFASLSSHNQHLLDEVSGGLLQSCTAADDLPLGASLLLGIHVRIHTTHMFNHNRSSFSKECMQT